MGSGLDLFLFYSLLDFVWGFAIWDTPRYIYGTQAAFLLYVIRELDDMDEITGWWEIDHME